MRRGKVNIVIGGQAGSESKGKLAVVLAEKFHPGAIVMAASPNAGHTAYFRGKKYVSYHLPISWIACPDAPVYLGPTSVIRPSILVQELRTLPVNKNRLMIHPRAVIIHDSYTRMERDEGLLSIGSTNQGVGIARMEKIRRTADITFANDVEELEGYIGDTVSMVNDSLDRGETILLEMTQGFDLDLEHGVDPKYCTSKMVNPAMALAEAGVSPSLLGHVYGVIRPYPIRVNNREGTSGPYDDAKEINWKKVEVRSGCPHTLQEFTTTTKLPRRIFEFSMRRFLRFLTVCRPDHLCLQFANYIDWDVYGVREVEELPDKVRDFLALLAMLERSCPVAYVGTSEESMVDMGVDPLVD